MFEERGKVVQEEGQQEGESNHLCPVSSVRRKQRVHGGFRSVGISWDFPGGPVVKIPFLHCRGCRFDLWSGK